MKQSLATRSPRRGWTPITQPVRLPEPAGRHSAALLLSVPLGFGLLISFEAITGKSLSPLTWYLIRASGITLYLLFWATVVLGLTLTTHTFDRMIGRGNAYSLHTYLTQLSYAFLAIHLLGLATDSYLVFSVADLIGPFHAPSKEPWTGMGVLAMWLFIVVAVTAASRRYVPYPVWRMLHGLAFPLFLLSMLHGIGAGSDSANSWVQAMYVFTASTVFGLTLLRVWTWSGHRKDQSQREDAVTGNAGTARHSGGYGSR